MSNISPSRPPFLATNSGGVDHVAGVGHPERPERLLTILDRIGEVSDAFNDVDVVEVNTKAPLADIRIHSDGVLSTLEGLNDQGGGQLDSDTGLNHASVDAARTAIATGRAAVEATEDGAPFGFCFVRPPGHHATPTRSMGFCLLNTVAVVADELTRLGKRVAILDWDAHHGNGTQDCFFDRDDVLFASWHQWPAYPGTGHPTEVGTGDGAGYTINVALAPGSTSRSVLASWDDTVAPRVTTFDPDVILISAGYDAHRADPITQMGLTSADFGLLGQRLKDLSSAVRAKPVLFLEGGYDLQALADSVQHTLGGLLGRRVETGEPVSSPTSADQASAELLMATERAHSSG